MRNFHFPGRSPVYAQNGMCATSHPQASLTAIETLRRGGNAVDAALSALGVLCVVEPHMTGIGGDCFVLMYKPGEGMTALNGAGKAPAAAEISFYQDQGLTDVDITSPHAVTVPGAIDAWARLATDHGTMTLAEILNPAIRLAEEGFVVAPRVAYDWADFESKLQVHEGARLHLLNQGKAPTVGQIVRFPALANTLRLIASKGRAAFYEDELAEDMVGELNELGGLHTREDFAGQSCRYVEPIQTHYRGLEVWQLPPSNQTVSSLMMLNILSQLPDIGHAPDSAKRYHTVMEAARLAYQARNRFVADPEFFDTPLNHLLSPKLARQLAARIDPERRSDDLGMVPEPEGSDTVYLSVVDQNGIAVSMINSLFAPFGSGIVTRKSGINFHNRGQGFRFAPGHPNTIAGGKRPLHTLIPAMTSRNGIPVHVFGVMGADFQPMGQVLVLTNMLDFGLDPQQALDNPRCFFDSVANISLEHQISFDVERELQRMGYSTNRVRKPWGGGQIVGINSDNGTLTGASDHRKDGLALGF